MTRKKLGKGAYGDRGYRVALWLEGDRIVAQWRSGRAGAKERKKRSWANTAENRAMAKAWAQELAKSLAAGLVVRALVTTAVLFDRYAEAEFSTLRARSQQLARDAWRAWSGFVGAETIAEDMGPDSVAGFKANLERRQLAVTTIGKTIGQIKTVYAWGYRHRLIARNDVRDYRYKIGKDQRTESPPEYTEAEVTAIEAKLPLEDGRTWRAGALFRLANLHGGRQNAIRHLRWEDIDLEAGTITWRREWDKQGKEDPVPMRPAARRVFEAIRHRTNGEGWVFPRGQKLGVTPVYTAQAAISTLRWAEHQAGVVTIRGRAYHGLRRKHFNDVLAAAGDVGTAAAALRDTDLRVLSKSYLKKRNPKLAAVYEQMDSEPNGTPTALEPSSEGK